MIFLTADWLNMPLSDSMHLVRVVGTTLVAMVGITIDNAIIQMFLPVI
jgi:hypothetical protein